MEEMAAHLAHEVRNPLTTINAITYALQRRVNRDSRDYNDLQVIHTEIERVTAVLKDFMQLARPIWPRPQRIQLAAALEEVEQIVGSLLEKRQVKYKRLCDPALMVSADPVQIKQVLLNLVKNAAEAMTRPGTITVRAFETVAKAGKNNEPGTIIEVHDTGNGIAPTEQAKVWEPFFSTKPDGTGLGLPITRRIIERHGGTIALESSPKKGTLFRITLPQKQR